MCLLRGGCCMSDVSCQDLVISHVFGHDCSQMVAIGRTWSQISQMVAEVDVQTLLLLEKSQLSLVII